VLLGQILLELLLLGLLLLGLLLRQRLLWLLNLLQLLRLLLLGLLEGLLLLWLRCLWLWPHRRLGFLCLHLMCRTCFIGLFRLRSVILCERSDLGNWRLLR